MTNRAKRIFLVLALLLFSGILLFFVIGMRGDCSLPKNYSQLDGEPTIWPDYKGVTVPPNIAPLNFLVDSVDDVVAHIVSPCSEHTYGGRRNGVQIDEQEWKSMLTTAKGLLLSATGQIGRASCRERV